MTRPRIHRPRARKPLPLIGPTAGLHRLALAAVAAAITCVSFAHAHAADPLQGFPEAGDCCKTPSLALVLQATSEVSTADAPTDERPLDRVDAHEGMVWVPGGEYWMGGDGRLAQPHEQPVHRVRVDGFWMDATEVTNAQFRAFVEDTGYVTVAERPVDWEALKDQVPPGTPKPPAEMLAPSSLVFNPPRREVDLQNYQLWWALKHGADWRHPTGPDSSIEGLDDHPVVQVCYDDALAYATWAGKQLPTEAQWERAARGGLDGKANTWGDAPADPTRANYWQGRFPSQNTAEDGFVGTAPVKSFPANGYGLYDMAGNVWEWTRDLYRTDTYRRRLIDGDSAAVIVNPAGPPKSFDPNNPFAPVLRVQRGGSFLCNDRYCANYRPSARMACTPDTALNHSGFRCVIETPAIP